MGFKLFQIALQDERTSASYVLDDFDQLGLVRRKNVRVVEKRHISMRKTGHCRVLSTLKRGGRVCRRLGCQAARRPTA